MQTGSSIESGEGASHPTQNFETPTKQLLFGLLDTDQAAGLAFTVFCGLFILYLLIQRRSELAETKEAYSYERLRAKNQARTQRLAELQAQHDKLAEEERQRQQEAKLKRQQEAQEAKVRRQAEELMGGRRVVSNAPLPRQVAEPTQRQQEMRQIEDAFQRAMAADVQRQHAVAAAAAADEQLLQLAEQCAHDAGMQIGVLPAKLARRNITNDTSAGDIMVMVRTSPTDSGGVRHVTVKCSADCSLTQLLAALHASLPAGGVTGKVLVQAHPRRQIARGDALLPELLGSGDPPAPPQAEAGEQLLLSSSLREAGIADRAMLMLRKEDDA